MKRTKIVATIGPSTETEEKLKELLLNGVDVVRLNFSHGTHEWHKNVIKKVRKISKELNKPVAILQDLGGPKIRLGTFKGEIELVKGDVFILSPDKKFNYKEKILPIQYEKLSEYLNIGDIIFLNDGKIEAKVLEIIGKDIKLETLNDGILSQKKGINIPATKQVRIPALTEKDKEDLKFGLENEVDWIALSFVQTADDIKELKTIINFLGYDTPVIAKIEKKAAIDNLPDIMKASDGIMVARGDLGIETPLEKVTLYQKIIIKAAVRHAKPVIVATQMLESMVSSPLPTRAEVSDVTNAILDGADAVMLSQETSVGKYPVESVKVMTKIAEETEHSINYINLLKKDIYFEKETITNAISFAAIQISQKVKAKYIVCCTMSGNTARIMTRYKHYAPILAFTPKESTYRQLALSWGTVPILVPEFSSLDEMIKIIQAKCKELNLTKSGDKLVITAGLPYSKSGATNIVRVIEIP